MPLPPAFTNELKVTYHHDAYGDEYVIRLHHPNGYDSLCGCPGEQEAQLVSSLLALCLQLGDVSFDEEMASHEGTAIRGVRISNHSLDSYLEMRGLADQAFGLLKEFAK